MAPVQPTSPAATSATTSAAATHPPSHQASAPAAMVQSQSHRADPASPVAARASTAASHDDRTARRLSRKLQKKRRDGEHTPTMELPERLKASDDHADSEEEVLQPQGYDGNMFMNMNQSIFGLIAAAGSRVDFADRFEAQSSDDEDDGDGAMAMTIAGHKRPVTQTSGSLNTPLAQTTMLRRPKTTVSKQEGRHRRKLSENRLLRSVPGLSRLATRSKSSKSPKTSDHDALETTQPPATPSPELAPSIEITRTENRTAPVMSRMLEARAQMVSRPSFDLERLSEEQATTADSADAGPTALAKKLAEIFEFDTPEEVIEEYPCWLLQHVLLQGYIYITARHFAFYAYLPKKANEVAKSGYLSKCGKRNPKYNRYWFRLKGDVLSYYLDPQNLYFPSGQIDLRYGISAEITDKDKDGISFTVTTHHRSYYFKADSPQSAKEWVKSLQRVIFQSHNDGDSVKISLPIANILDIEEMQMLDFADTCKIRVIDNDETYAIDEYFFSFFAFGKEAISLIKLLVDPPDSSDPTPDRNESGEPSGNATPWSKSKNSSRSGSKPPAIRTSKLDGEVKATLSPRSPLPSPSPRASGDFTRSSFDALRPFGRRSLDVAHPASPRRSFSDSRRSHSRQRLAESRAEPEKQGSSDSYVQSLEDPSHPSMSAMIVSGTSEEPSASQILQGSDVFHSPTIQRSSDVARAKDGTATAHRGGASGSHKSSAQQLAVAGSAADGTADADPNAATTPTLKSIATMGRYPFQKANAFMGYLDKQSRRMSTLLATESMGYVEKVSGMWKGGKKHYYDDANLKTDEDDDHEDDPEVRANSEARFRAHFALPETEKLQAAYFGYLLRVLPLYGKIYIGDRHFCFRSLLPGTRTKLILPLKDVENADKEKGFRFGYSGLVVVIRGHEELFFEFNKAGLRDDCCVTLLQNIDAVRYSLSGQEDTEEAHVAVAEHNALEEARNEEFPSHQLQLPRNASSLSEAPTILFDDPKASFLSFKPSQSMRVTCLTIGSRGDVQPYIALCKKLLEEGHRPRIATHGEFKDWIESHGIEYAFVGGDPSELMRICIQNGTFTWSFLREANSKFRGWLDELLETSWKACQGSDLIIESPSAMAGIHIAEALGVPYFRAFTMPWTRTRAYPHAFIMPGQKMGGAYNYFTYVMFDNVFWKAMAPQVNRWRNAMLGLPNTNLEKLQINKVPFLYNFSPFVVPPPLDYSDWIRVTGYWFLDEGGSKWTPPKELTDFIDKARRDDKKLVYVGFGSIIVPDPAKMTQEVIDAVLKADVRCILSKGWSDRLPSKDEKADLGSEKKPEPVLPPEILQIKSAPHDWLFRQIDAAAHHGGSGTTGASLRAGIPTIIRPFFGDQFFFGMRVEDLGVGICLKKWGANSFARALWEATHSERIIHKAKILGEQIRKENGVETAIQCIYRDLEYATNLIKSKAGKNHSRKNEGIDAIDPDIEEESWTFVNGDTLEPVDGPSNERTSKQSSLL